MEAAPDHSTARDRVQDALKAIKRQHSGAVHQAALDVLTVLEQQDDQRKQRVVDEVQTRPDLASDDVSTIVSGMGVLGLHGLVWLDPSGRIALTKMVRDCLDPTRETM